MQSATRIAVSAFLITSALASAYQNTAKLRRDGVLNLFPFPRVGRAQKQTWLVPLEEPQLEHKSEQKRQLYAFPRVGRSDALVATDNREMVTDNRDMTTDNREMTTDNKEYRKRQMYAFPRVGRTGLPFTLEQLRALNDLSQLFRPRQLPPRSTMAEPINQSQQTTPVLASLDNRRLHQLMKLMLEIRRNSLVKRESAKDQSGMWFGPRMGRSAKDSGDENIAVDNQNNELGEPESTQQTLNEDRKKRQAQ